MKFPLTIFNKNSTQIIDTEDDFKNILSTHQLIQAAGGIVVNPDSYVLLMKRNEMWDLPKGKVDQEESIREAAIREVQEETGLSELTIIAPCMASYHTYSENNSLILKETHWFLMFTGQLDRLVPQIEENITYLQWCHPDAVTGLLSLSYPSLQAVWKEVLTNEDTNYLFKELYP